MMILLFFFEPNFCAAMMLLLRRTLVRFVRYSALSFQKFPHTTI